MLLLLSWLLEKRSWERFTPSVRGSHKRRTGALRIVRRPNMGIRPPRHVASSSLPSEHRSSEEERRAKRSGTFSCTPRPYRMIRCLASTLAKKHVRPLFVASTERFTPSVTLAEHGPLMVPEQASLTTQASISDNPSSPDRPNQDPCTTNKRCTKTYALTRASKPACVNRNHR
jgi:hypothetical protein